MVCSSSSSPQQPIIAPRQARILYVDFAAKRAGLSLLPHLINCRMPAAVPILGQVRDRGCI
jgi:hypothetical protein